MKFMIPLCYLSAGAPKMYGYMVKTRKKQFAEYSGEKKSENRKEK